MGDDKLREALVSLHSAVDEAMGDSDLIGVEDDTNLFAAMQKASTALAATADAPPEVTEEMVTAGLKATERWGVAKSQGKPTGSAPPYMVFEVGEHPRTFIEDIVRAALATAQKEG
jgi:hypothetical protein